ncbi:MAG: hypothetical protein H7Z42_21925 [Roseiflexaceae bacterium]|nr:hypothetical protein [Roseiflexaceae bacterium]
MDTTRPRSMNSIALALIPLAMAINIAIGTLATGTPIYLDSVGTVLVGALLGPWYGLLTGILSNVVWTLVFGNQIAIWFTPVAAAIGFIAGVAGRSHLFYRASPKWLSALVGAAFLFALTLFVLMFIARTFDNQGNAVFPTMQTLFAENGLIFVLALVAGAVAGYAVLQQAGYIGTIGLATGVLAALISAPISAYLFGGVTGAGTDLLVAAFQASGASIIQSVFAQGVVSDPFDKLTSFMLVWLAIQSLPRRLLARFPYGRSQPPREAAYTEAASSRP